MILRGQKYMQILYQISHLFHFDKLSVFLLLHSCDHTKVTCLPYISDHEESQQKIFFDGQIYDAFSLLIDLVASATKSLVLVDNYVDVGTLNILSKKKENVSVTIYTVRKTRLSEKDIETFNQQYPKLEVNYTGVFHDRFLIIDDKKAYHIGASLKDAGKKCFAISLLNDSGVIYDILQRLDIETEENES